MKEIEVTFLDRFLFALMTVAIVAIGYGFFGGLITLLGTFTNSPFHSQ